MPLLVLSYALLWSTAVSKTRRLELQTEAADLSLEAPGCPEATCSWLLGGYLQLAARRLVIAGCPEASCNWLPGG